MQELSQKIVTIVGPKTTKPEDWAFDLKRQASALINPSAAPVKHGRQTFAMDDDTSGGQRDPLITSTLIRADPDRPCPAGRKHLNGVDGGNVGHLRTLAIPVPGA